MTATYYVNYSFLTKGVLSYGYAYVQLKKYPMSVKEMELLRLSLTEKMDADALVILNILPTRD